MIKGVFFDAHGVLYDRREPTERYALRLLTERGYSAELSAVDRTRLRALRDQATIGRRSPHDYWDAHLAAHGVPKGERAPMVSQILRHADEVIAMPEAAATLAALKVRGFLLGVITDTMYPLPVKMGWLARAGLADYFHVISCSTALGARKPDPRIYLDALARARLTAAEAAFVGHEARELEGARRVGMVTVAAFCGPNATADYRVAALPNLLDLPIFRPSPNENHPTRRPTADQQPGTEATK